METSCVAYPTEVNINVFTEGETEMRKEPSAMVCVASLVPLAETVTPAKADPSLASVTFPVITLSCA